MPLLLHKAGVLRRVVQRVLIAETHVALHVPEENVLCKAFRYCIHSQGMVAPFCIVHGWCSQPLPRRCSCTLSCSRPKPVLPKRKFLLLPEFSISPYRTPISLPAASLPK